MRNGLLLFVLILAVLTFRLFSGCRPDTSASQPADAPVISSSSVEDANYSMIITVTRGNAGHQVNVHPPKLQFTTEIKQEEAALPYNSENAFNTCKAEGNLDFEVRALKLANIERQKRNLPPLIMDPDLVTAARGHSADMACRNFFSHYGMDRSTPFDRMRSAGYAMVYAGENIYAGPEIYNDPAQAVRHWMNSPSHRAAILNPNYTEAGVGYYFYKPAAYDGYFTMDFASPDDEKTEKTRIDTQE
jgi:uncharacterized protein YkwD